MTKTISSLLSIVAISTLTIGCESSNTTEKEPTEITTPTASGTTSSTLNSSQISAGVITIPVTISVTTTNNTSTATVTLAEGTAFTNSDRNTLNNVIPKLELTQETGSSNVTQTVQTKIKLTDVTGNKIIPTEAVKVMIKAPSNAKPGDEVKVSVPNGASKSTTQEKLINFIVDANGFITITIAPEVFKNFLVILIIIEKTTVTGLQGGN